MRQLSIKTKVTLWYVLFFVLILLLVFAFIASVSGNLLRADAQSQLKNIVVESAGEIEWEDGQLEIESDFAFMQNGVYLSIYDPKGKLLYGYLPAGFDQHEAFGREKIRESRGPENRWYVYDQPLGDPRGQSYWIRGVASATTVDASLRTTVILMLISLPFIVLIAAVGGYWITKRAFRPVSRIAQAAEKISSGNDLSQRIQLGRGQDEIYQLAHAFDHMFDRLQLSFEAEKQFTSDVSHELRTPTSVIVSRSAYALEHPEDPGQMEESLQVIHQQGVKMTRMISQLLLLARADNQTQTLDFEKLDMSEIAEMVVEEQREFAREKNITIFTAIQPGLFSLADQTMMIRLWINLISNSITYGNEGGHIWVTLEQQNGMLQGLVQDDGIGIAPEHLPHIWNRFYQVDAARTAHSQRGAGLGLSMVRWIVQAHQGCIEVNSQPGQGSSFCFTLPQRL